MEIQHFHILPPNWKRILPYSANFCRSAVFIVHENTDKMCTHVAVFQFELVYCKQRECSVIRHHSAIRLQHQVIKQMPAMENDHCELITVFVLSVFPSGVFSLLSALTAGSYPQVTSSVRL